MKWPFRKDPIAALEQKRVKLLEEAMRIQRSGNLRLYAERIEAISKLEQEIDSLRGRSGTSL